jgi:hypothetical protein
VLSTRISPPSSAAIWRLIVSPSPVPPNRRLVVPSACWNASKMSCCLSFAMPMPVSPHGERDHRLRLVEDPAREPLSLLRLADRERDPALLGELERVREQVLEHLLHSLAVGEDRRRHLRLQVDGEREALLLRHLLERPLGERLEVAHRHLGDVHLHLAGFDLRQVEDLVDEVEQVRARRVDRLRELHLLRREVVLLVVREELREDEQRVERRAQLVAHVRQELALVPRAERELLGLLLEREPRAFHLAVLLLDLLVLLGEQRGLLLQLLVDLLQLLLLLLEQLLGLPQRLRLRLSSELDRLSSSCCCCSSFDWLCSSCVSFCDCSSSSSVRMFALIMFSTTPIDSESWSRKVWWIWLNGGSSPARSPP